MTPLPAVVLAAQALLAAFPTPDCAVPGWTVQGPARSYDRETLFDYMDGNSEGYFAYGFTLMQGVTCVNAASDQLVIDVSEMGDPDRAWGVFVTNRDQRSPIETIGSGGQVLPRRATFAKGRYYVEIAASPDKDHRDVLRAFVRALEPRVPGEGRVPEAVAWFPRDGLEPDSVRLVPESVLGLRLLKTGFVGKYAAGRAFVVPEASPQAAAATMEKLRARFAGSASVAGVGDDAFSAQDQYLGRLLLFRKGPRVAGVANASTETDATALAGALAGRLP
ncbi:MAG TPA: DUF6599 family protein [Vicinamibacteria bacterium]|nr:DUF6599 family protein [Vicinamibacteria bacterium]